MITSNKTTYLTPKHTYTVQVRWETSNLARKTRTRITFIGYAHSEKIAKPNNIK